MNYRYLSPILFLIVWAGPVFLRTQPHLRPAPINKLSLPLTKILNKGDGNIVHSPLSLTTALAIIREASTGTAFDKINQFFGEDLSEVLSKVSDAANQANYTKLKNLNVVLHQNNVNLKDSFKSSIKSKYSGLTKSFDLTKTSEAVNYVNNFVANNTQNLIPKIIDDISQETSVMLVNAVLFDAKWWTPFKPGFDGVFHGTSGDKQVQYMRQNGEIRHAHSTDLKVQAIELKYQDEYSMIVMLPDTNSSLTELVDNLTEESFNNLFLSMRKKSIKVILPKFKIESQFDIVPVLTETGLGELFGTGLDFSKMADGKVRISSGVHKTVVSINEQGTQAAASTVVAFETYSLVYNEFVLTFDKPFMIVIRDTFTNSDLFVGLIKNI